MWDTIMKFGLAFGPSLGLVVWLGYLHRRTDKLNDKIDKRSDKLTSRLDKRTDDIGTRISTLDGRVDALAVKIQANESSVASNAAALTRIENWQKQSNTEIHQQLRDLHGSNSRLLQAITSNTTKLDALLEKWKDE